MTRTPTLTIFGSSITSAYWNGAATYYRGICKAMHERGYRIVFVEPDIYDRQQHRDLDVDPDYAEVRVTHSEAELRDALEEASESDFVAKCSGVGDFEEMLEYGVLRLREKGKQPLVIFWDVDAPFTLNMAKSDPDWYFRNIIPSFDLILTYGGGKPVIDAYTDLGAKRVEPVYNAVDPDLYYPVEPDPEYVCDLLFMGNRMPDREERVRQLFFASAEQNPDKSFILGGEGWGDYKFPPNVRWIGHIPTALHNVVNCSAKFVLNINRPAMAEYGFSPPTRIFEAAGNAACLISDAWRGLNTFFEPGREILMARSPSYIRRYLNTVSDETARAIGQRARARVIRDHTYTQRAARLDSILREMRPM